METSLFSSENAKKKKKIPKHFFKQNIPVKAGFVSLGGRLDLLGFVVCFTWPLQMRVGETPTAIVTVHV